MWGIGGLSLLPVFFFFLKKVFLTCIEYCDILFLCNMLSHLILLMTQWGRYNHVRISSKKKERVRVRSRGLGEDWQNWSFWIHLFLLFSSYLPFLWCVYSALPWILWVNRFPSWTGGVVEILLKHHHPPSWPLSRGTFLLPQQRCIVAAENIQLTEPKILLTWSFPEQIFSEGQMWQGWPSRTFYSYFIESDRTKRSFLIFFFFLNFPSRNTCIRV